MVDATKLRNILNYIILLKYQRKRWPLKKSKKAFTLRANLIKRESNYSINQHSESQTEKHFVINMRTKSKSVNLNDALNSRKTKHDAEEQRKRKNRDYKAGESDV